MLEDDINKKLPSFFNILDLTNFLIKFNKIKTVKNIFDFELSIDFIANIDNFINITDDNPADLFTHYNFVRNGIKHKQTNLEFYSSTINDIDITLTEESQIIEKEFSKQQDVKLFFQNL
jgi:hypothetical protein